MDFFCRALPEPMLPALMQTDNDAIHMTFLRDARNFTCRIAFHNYQVRCYVGWQLGLRELLQLASVRL